MQQKWSPCIVQGMRKIQRTSKENQRKKQTISESRKQTYLNVNPNISFANILKMNNANARNLDNRNNINSLNIANNSFLEDIKNSILNLSNQIINFQKQLAIQASRIDTVFSLINV